MISTICKNSFYLLLLIFSNISYSQTKISGYVTEVNNSPLGFASVVLQDSSATRIISYSFSNDKGYYELAINTTGKYVLSFSTIGFERNSFAIEITTEQKNIEKNVSLNYKPIELKEIIIENVKPIIIKKDTIIFDVKSFAQGNEQVVEDLLKKIPGLTVTSDGTIKVGNQEVEKIMIDGDDMFEKGYKLLTKNMPVNPLDKVELYLHYSNNKHLKGIENSEKVALNLILKEKFKRVWFGNAHLGYAIANESINTFGGNLMNFGKKHKYYFIANHNNIGVDATGDINHLIRPFRFDEPASIGDDQTANSLLGLSTDLPNLNKKRVNFNNAKLLSLNSIFTLSAKLKLKTLGFLNSDANQFYRNNFQSFKVGNTNFQNTENYYGKKSSVTGFGKLD